MNANFAFTLKLLCHFVTPLLSTEEELVLLAEDGELLSSPSVYRGSTRRGREFGLKSLNLKYKGRPFYRCPARERGKSGQRRASYFLTESYLQRWSNVEENNRHNSYGKRGKGEKVG